MAPATVPSSDHTHMPGPAVRNIRTVKPVPRPTPIEPMSRRPRRSARRPPTTIPMPPGVLVRIWKAMIPPAEKPRSVRRYSLRNELAGSTNSASRKPGPRQQEQAAAVHRRQLLAPSELRAGAALTREPLGLGEPATEEQHDRDGRQRHEVEDAPRADAEIGHLQQHHRDARAERGGGRQHRHRERPRAGGHLLDRDDADDQGERGRERPGQRLADAEPGQGRGTARRWR